MVRRRRRNVQKYDPCYLCQVGNDLSAFDSGVVVLINEQGLNHHQDLGTKIDSSSLLHHLLGTALAVSVCVCVSLPCVRRVEQGRQVCREYGRWLSPASGVLGPQGWGTWAVGGSGWTEVLLQTRELCLWSDEGPPETEGDGIKWLFVSGDVFFTDDTIIACYSEQNMTVHTQAPQLKTADGFYITHSDHPNMWAES